MICWDTFAVVCRISKKNLRITYRRRPPVSVVVLRCANEEMWVSYGERLRCGDSSPGAWACAGMLQSHCPIDYLYLFIIMFMLAPSSGDAAFVSGMLAARNQTVAVGVVCFEPCWLFLFDTIKPKRVLALSRLSTRDPPTTHIHYSFD